MLRSKLLLAALLAFVPAAGFAMACQGDHTANVCETGYTWDEETGACVEVITG